MSPSTKCACGRAMYYDVPRCPMCGRLAASRTETNEPQEREEYDPNTRDEVLKAHLDAWCGGRLISYKRPIKTSVVMMTRACLFEEHGELAEQKVLGTLPADGIARLAQVRAEIDRRSVSDQAAPAFHIHGEVQEADFQLPTNADPTGVYPLCHDCGEWKPGGPSAITCAPAPGERAAYLCSDCAEKRFG